MDATYFKQGTKPCEFRIQGANNSRRRSFDNHQMGSGTISDEFTPKHDSFELLPEDQLLASALHEPPYTSPKNNWKHSATGEEETQKLSSGSLGSESERAERQLSLQASAIPDTKQNMYSEDQVASPLKPAQEANGRQLDQPLHPTNGGYQHRNRIVPFYDAERDEQAMGDLVYEPQQHHHPYQDFKDEPELLLRPDSARVDDYDFDTDLAKMTKSNQLGGGSAQPVVRQSALLEKKVMQKTKITNAVPNLEQIEDLLYLDAQKSAEDRPSVAGQLVLHEPSNLLIQGKHSEGTATALQATQGAAIKDRLVSATCRYSSWERAHGNSVGGLGSVGQNSESLVDSLSRYFNLSFDGSESDQSGQGQSADICSLVSQAKLQADNFGRLALASCSTSAQSIRVKKESESLSAKLSKIEGLVKEQQDGGAIKGNFKARLKAILRSKNVGVDAKRFQAQANLQKDVAQLLGRINELADKNARLMNKQKRRLRGYEREVYSLMQAIQTFFSRHSSMPREASQLGHTSTFTGYNGMRLGEEVTPAPGMALLANQQKNSISMISAYGSQGPLPRDTSQILNLTPLQAGITSTLTNSNLKTVLMNSNNSSGEHVATREELGARQSASKILIADQSDNSIIGQLKQTGLASSRENIMNNAMIGSMTQRSHNIGGTEDNAEQSGCITQRAPQTARCALTLNKSAAYNVDQSFLIGQMGNRRIPREVQALLDFLNEKLRSLAERINEVVTTKLGKTQRDKSYGALSSLKSLPHTRQQEAQRSHRPGGKRNRSDSRLKSVRGSSKSRRMMRFKRFKKRNHQSVEPCINRGHASRHQTTPLYTENGAFYRDESSVSRQNSKSCSPIGSSRMNPFNRAFIKSTYRTGAAPYGQTLGDTTSIQQSRENSQQYFTGPGAYFHFGGPVVDQSFPLCKTQAVRARLPSQLLNGNRSNLQKVVQEKTQAGFYSARNDLEMRHYLTKPSETVPVTNVVSRLVSGVASTNLSHDQDNVQPFSTLIRPEYSQPPCSPNKKKATQERMIQPFTRVQEAESPTRDMNHVMSLSKLSERRQEFSATFNNQLSSVKKDNESSMDNKSAGALLPNFYPAEADGANEPETSPFEVPECAQLFKEERKATRHAKQKQLKKGKSVTHPAGRKKGNYETEDAPKIPKLNLGKLKAAGARNEFFTKNISEVDDNSLGDYDMILKNQKFALHSSKDPSLLTASKSQNNQSLGSFHSRFGHKGKLKSKETFKRLTYNKRSTARKQIRGVAKQGATHAFYSSQAQGSQVMGQGLGPVSKAGKKRDKQDPKLFCEDPSLTNLSAQRQKSAPKMPLGFAKTQINLKKINQQSDGNNVTQTTSCYALQQNTLDSNPIGLASVRIHLKNDALDVPQTQTMEVDDEADPYMSFIDSDKFSPIQSVSGEEIDDDDSLDQHKAEILFSEKAQDEHEHEQDHVRAHQGSIASEGKIFSLGPIDQEPNRQLTADAPDLDNFSVRTDSVRSSELKTGSRRQNMHQNWVQEQQHVLGPNPVASQQAPDFQHIGQSVGSDFATSFEQLLDQFDGERDQKNVAPQQAAHEIQKHLETLDRSLERARTETEKSYSSVVQQPALPPSIDQPQEPQRSKYQVKVAQKTPKSSKFTHRSKSSSISPNKLANRKIQKPQADKKQAEMRIQQHPEQRVKAKRLTKKHGPKALKIHQQLSGQQTNDPTNQPIQSKQAHLVHKAQKSPRKGPAVLGHVHSAAKFHQADTNNFTLGAANINVFTLTPRAFSNSMLSSLSKELLSNLSSGQKNKPFVFSFQGSQTKLDQPPQQYLVDPQAQAIQHLLNNPNLQKAQTATVQANPATQQPITSVSHKKLLAMVQSKSKESLKAAQKGLKLPARELQERDSSLNTKSLTLDKPQEPQREQIAPNGTQIISQELPRHVSHRQINENILVLPLQMQKRRELQKHEGQTSKKSLCLQETFPETLITLNREILAKRLSSTGASNSGQKPNQANSVGLKSARESYRTLITTQEAVRDPDGLLPKSGKVSSLAPPRVPQTTRNVVKMNNFVGNIDSSTPAVKDGKPIKFNFKLNVASKKREKSGKKETKAQNVSQSGSTLLVDQNSIQSCNDRSKESKNKQRLGNLRQLNSRHRETQKAQMGNQMDFYPAQLDILSPTATTTQAQGDLSSCDQYINFSAHAAPYPQTASSKSATRLTQAKNHRNLVIESDSRPHTRKVERRMIASKDRINSSSNFALSQSTLKGTSVTPRNLTVLPKSSIHRFRQPHQPALESVGGTQDYSTLTTPTSNALNQSEPQGASKQSKTNLTTLNLMLEILSPQGGLPSDQASKAKREKVMRQLMASLVKKQAQSAAARNQTTYLSQQLKGQTLDLQVAQKGPNQSQLVKAQGTQRKKSKVKHGGTTRPVQEIETGDLRQKLSLTSQPLTGSVTTKAMPSTTLAGRRLRIDPNF